MPVEYSNQQTPPQYRYLENDPEARFVIREKFYQKFGRDFSILRRIWRFIIYLITGGEGEGHSELDFLRWEIDRGVLNPLNESINKGSPWWRNVNLDFIVISETAGEIALKKQQTEVHNNEISHWLNYIEKRTGKSWYRAHNASITRGFLNRIEEAKLESHYEQAFMNEVLTRLLFAQSMEEDSSIFKNLGIDLANPLLSSVDIMVHLPDFYPDNYPLTKDDVRNILHKGYGLEGDLEDWLDEKLIIPHLRHYTMKPQNG